MGNASFRLLQSLSDKNLTGFPQLHETASRGGAFATTVARDILLDRKVDSGRRVSDARKVLGLKPDMAVAEKIQVLRDSFQVTR
jgi:hypothetical protein